MTPRHHVTSNLLHFSLSSDQPTDNGQLTTPAPRAEHIFAIRVEHCMYYYYNIVQPTIEMEMHLSEPQQQQRRQLAGMNRSLIWLYL